MKSLRKLAVAVGLLALACSSGQYGQGTGTDQAAARQQVDCSTVRCEACPTGQTPRLKPPDCCRCVPVDDKIKNCDNVRCAACPEGQHPALTPPDCCRCVPD